MQKQYADTVSELESKIVELNTKIGLLKLGDSNFQTYMLGQTGVGKSTLTNCIMNNHLEWEHKKSKYLCHNDLLGPKIGNQFGKSQTTTPSSFQTTQYGQIIDNPGMHDTRGDIQDILTSYSYAKLFQSGRKIKLIIVFQFSDLENGRGRPITQIISLIRKIFTKQNLKQLSQSCLLVVSKIMKEYFTVNQIVQWIISILQEQKCEDQLLFVRNIVNKNGLLFFPTPENQELQIDSESIKFIRQKLLTISPYTLKQSGNIQLTNKSKHFLSTVATKAYKNLQNQSLAISESLNKQIQKDLTLNQFKPVKLQKIQNTTKFIVEQFQSPQTLHNIEKNLKKLQVPAQVISNTVKQLHKLEFCQLLQPNLKLPTKSKQLIYKNLIQPVVYSCSKLQKQLQTQELALKLWKQHKNLSQNQLSNQNEIQQKILFNYSQHLLEEDQLSAKRNNQISQSMLTSFQKEESQKLKVLMAFNDQLKKSQWQNYQVHITTRTCSIM